MKTTKEKYDNVAYELAELSCMLAQTCNEKEFYFAAKYGITPAEFKCLRLFLISNPISIKEISAHMSITPGRITHILTSLEMKGFITREMDRKDRRNVNVCLTEKSMPFIKNLSEGHLQLHRDIMASIPENKRDELIKAMKELVKIIKPFTQHINK